MAYKLSSYFFKQYLSWNALEHLRQLLGLLTIRMLITIS
jgi:hypothetical protein